MAWRFAMEESLSDRWSVTSVTVSESMEKREQQQQQQQQQQQDHQQQDHQLGGTPKIQGAHLSFVSSVRPTGRKKGWKISIRCIGQRQRAEQMDGWMDGRGA